MKKYFALIFTILLTMCLFVGCNDNNNKKDEAITITCLFDGDRLEGETLETDPTVEFIEKKFNVEFDFICEPSPTINEVFIKLNMMMANGEVPDLMVMRADLTLPYTCMEDLVEAKYLVDLKKYVKGKEDKFPKISELVNRDGLETFYASDDNLYMLPREYVYDHAFIYRQDWLDELGLSMPTNETEFKNVLKAFVDNDPDGKGTTGLAMIYGFWFEHILAGFVGAHRFYEQDGALRSVWDADGERADQLMEGLQYCIDLYNEGLLYSDVFTAMQYRDELALFETGRAGVMLTNMSVTEKFYDNLKKNFPDAKISYGAWSGPAGLARVQGGVGYYQGTAINAKSGKADIIMEILEYLMSEEGETLLTKGIEGVHYNMVDGKLVPNLDAKGINYYFTPTKHYLRGIVGGTDVFDEYLESNEWAEAYENFYNDYCLNSTAVYDMTDGYFSRLPKRVQAQVGNDPEINIQKWEGYFITGKADGKPISLNNETFHTAWADLKSHKLDLLASEYSKIILGKK